MVEKLEDSEALLDRAIELADRHFNQAIAESGDLAAYVSIAMIEVAANAAVDALGSEDAAALLRDLAEQIEGDPVENGED